MGTKETTIDLDSKMDEVPAVAENDFIVADGTPKWVRKPVDEVKPLMAQLVYDTDYGCYFG